LTTDHTDHTDGLALDERPVVRRRHRIFSVFNGGPAVV